MKHAIVCAASLAALIGAGCGQQTLDDRPRTTEYITEAIFRPTCGGAACHSAFAQKAGLALDTVENVRYAAEHDDDFLRGWDSGQTPQLITVLTTESVNGDNRYLRMPLDAPLPEEDVRLIRDWLDLGAPGICKKPNSTQCRGKSLATCDADGAIASEAQNSGCK